MMKDEILAILCSTQSLDMLINLCDYCKDGKYCYKWLMRTLEVDYHVKKSWKDSAAKSCWKPSHSRIGDFLDAFKEKEVMKENFSTQ